MNHSKPVGDQMAFWRFMFLAQCALNIAFLGFFVAGSVPSDAQRPSLARGDAKEREVTFDTVRARRFLVTGPDGKVLATFVGMDDGGCALVMSGGRGRRSGVGVAITPAGVVGFNAWHAAQRDAIAWALSDRGLTVSAKGPGDQSAVGVQLGDKFASAWTCSGAATTHWQWQADGQKTWSHTADTGQKTNVIGEATLRFMKLILESIRSELDSR